MQGFFTPMNVEPAEGNSYASGSLASVIILTHVSGGENKLVRCNLDFLPESQHSNRKMIIAIFIKI